ncbi:AraC family transcriptional regulator (plasmid) [Streptomyces sp. BI20]|uniref:helix-turn-helix transcriptional regulator n=1 Tax=Streptomyces sp. BI20 TaxID=3403460 RepID=UPI003C76647B
MTVTTAPRIRTGGLPRPLAARRPTGPLPVRAPEAPAATPAALPTVTPAPAGGAPVADAGHPPHAHAAHRFLYVVLGRVTVHCPTATHELDPTTALWIPAGVVHGTRFAPHALVRTESFAADRFALPGHDPVPVTVTEAQRALLLGRMRSCHAESDDPDVFAALSGAHPDSLPLPHPRTPAAAAVARALTRRPGDPRTVTEWAAELYTSPTSLRRAFRAETGMAFSEWRTRLRLNQALPLLDRGQLVGVVAGRVGFASANGFILAFRRHFGRTPGAYVRRIRADRPA